MSDENSKSLVKFSQHLDLAFDSKGPRQGLRVLLNTVSFTDLDRC
jgi:hypothetical protein